MNGMYPLLWCHTEYLHCPKNLCAIQVFVVLCFFFVWNLEVAHLPIAFGKYIFRSHLIVILA